MNLLPSYRRENRGKAGDPPPHAQQVRAAPERKLNPGWRLRLVVEGRHAGRDTLKCLGQQGLGTGVAQGSFLEPANSPCLCCMVRLGVPLEKNTACFLDIREASFGLSSFVI